MFLNISWKEFSIFIGTSTFIYYMIVLIVYYRKDILKFVRPLLPGKVNFEGQDSNLPNSNNLISEDIESPNIVDHIQNRIIAQLQMANLNKVIKEEMIFSLRSIINDYSEIQLESRGKINDYIKNICNEMCSIHLEKEELDQLWFR